MARSPQGGRRRAPLDTCGSDYDTVVAVYSGCPGAPATELACNDDWPTGNDLTAGQLVYLRVSTYDGTPVGGFQLNIPQDPGLLRARAGRPELGRRGELRRHQPVRGAAQRRRSTIAGKEIRQEPLALLRGLPVADAGASSD